MRIAIDAMGGDLAPSAPIDATLSIAGQHREVSFFLIGDEARVKDGPVRLPDNVKWVQTESVIDSGEEPVRAVRRKRDSSLVMAAQMVANHEADVMVSAGNTGALVAAGLLVIGRLEGIERPALAPMLPTFSGRGMLLLDAGATMDATSQNLLQYAQMGRVYCQYVLGIDAPRVGLLNVGTEDGKGNTLAKETHERLRNSTLDYHGNVEARDLLAGNCDVVICDGFVGNVVLKLVEGVGLGLFAELKQAMLSDVRSKLGAAILKPSLAPLRKKFDYTEYGGAPFLGVAGGCIKAHGSSNEHAWFTALRQAVSFASQNLLEKITLALGEQ